MLKKLRHDTFAHDVQSDDVYPGYTPRSSDSNLAPNLTNNKLIEFK